MKNKIKTIIFGAVLIFIGSFSIPTSTFATLPEILTVQASLVTQTSATLHASFDANGASDIDVRFEYGTSPLFGNTTPYTNYTTQTGTHQVSITVSSGTTYYFRAMAVADGPGYGNALSFTTPSYILPNMLTTSATNIDETSATLNSFYNGNNGGTVTIWFQYANNSSFIGAYTTSQASQINNSGSFSTNISGLEENTTYFFRVFGQNSGGTTIGQPVLSFTTQEEYIDNDPIEECVIDYFNASDISVDEGDDVTLSWTTTNCESVYLNGDGISGYYGTDDSVQTDNLYNDETFTLTATGSDNTETGSVTINVDNDNGNNNDEEDENNDDCEITDFDISPNNISYGGSVTISWETNDCDNVEIVGGNINDDYGNDGDIIVGPIYYNTTFHIYADGDEGDDSDYETVTVSSLPIYVPPYVPPVFTPTYNYDYTQPKTITKTVFAKGSGDNLLNLTVEPNGKDICLSNIYQTTIKYKNVSGQDLKNVVLKVKLPQNVAYRSSSSGLYSQNEHAIILNVKEINKGNEGVIYINGNVKNIVIKENIAVTEAVASFLNPKNNITENAIAYSVQDVNRCGNSLTSLALFGGNFFPNTFTGWLILIIAISGLLIIAKELYGKAPNRQVNH